MRIRDYLADGFGLAAFGLSFYITAFLADWASATLWGL